MAWLKMEYATIDKPEIIAMADLMEKSPDEVFGMCFRVWCWFDANSTDGNAGSNAGSVTGASLQALVNRLAGDVRFAAAMKKVGWLTDSGVTNFSYHMGESSKKRALTTRRQKTHREKSNAKSNAEVTLGALPEKRREEKKETSKSFSLPDWVPVESWKGWLEVRAKIKAPNTDRALKLALADLSSLRGQGHDPEKVLDTATARGWKALYPTQKDTQAANQFQGVL